MDNDGTVSGLDLAVFCAGWLSTLPASEGDIDRSGRVDFGDFAVLAGEYGGL
jgi:hypothetical protein